MNDEPTKVCPLCAETIKAAAKVCPHCRHLQKFWSFSNPQLLSIIGAITLFVLLASMGVLYDKMFALKEQFATYRNEITVIGSQFSYRIANSNLMITVVGTLTNRSSINWKDVGVESQFFDQTGKLIDVIKVNADNYNGVTILPHGEAAFKIEGRAAHPASEYFTNVLNVRWAKDVAQIF